MIGNCTITTNVNLIASINPFKYRGYYFDDETGFYYCNTRYYNPELGRWISPDSFKYIDPETINGVNLYSYKIKATSVKFAYGGSNLTINNKISNSISLNEEVKLSVNAPYNVWTINNTFNWPNLDFLTTGFGIIDNAFSIISGIIDGIRNLRQSGTLDVLDNISKWMTGIGIGINVGLSLYNNLTNPNLSNAQKAGNILGDVIYIMASTYVTCAISSATSMIPIAGPFIAPIVSFGCGTVLNQFWYGEEILWIDGFFSIQVENQLMNG